MHPCSMSWEADPERCNRPASHRVGDSGRLRRSCVLSVILLMAVAISATATVSAAQPDTTDRGGRTPVMILTAPMHGWVLGTSSTGLAFYAVPPCGCGQRAAECALGAAGCSMTAVVSVDGREVLRLDLNEENNFAYSSGGPCSTPGGFETLNPPWRQPRGK